MNKFFSFLAFTFFYSGLFSQKLTEDFELVLPEQKVQNSLYDKIDFIDSRYDVTNMGIVQLGAFNRKARVIPKAPFALQLSGAIASLTDTSAKHGELLLQLRQFNFAEITSGMSEKGYCYLRAQLYSKRNNSYQILSSIDTIIVVRGMDVTKGLLRNGSKAITTFISSNLLNDTPDTVSYSMNNILAIDDYEKRTMAVYTTQEYTDGMYITFQSFRDQHPDKKPVVEIKGERITSVKTNDESGKPVKVKAKDIYAVVYNKQPYIATEYGYYPLRKTGNDFYFTGKAKTTANSADVIAASMFFGIIGGLLASNTDATFEMKIDHINGGFIRMREVADNAY